MGRNFSEEFTNEEDITVDSDSAAGRQLGGRTIVVKFVKYNRPDRYIDEFDSVGDRRSDRSDVRTVDVRPDWVNVRPVRSVEPVGLHVGSDS